MIEDEYGINNKPYYPGNSQVKTITKRIHHVLWNIVRTYNQQENYVDDTDTCMVILAVSAFAVRPKYHRNKYKRPGQLVFCRDMILPINHVADWRYIHQRKKTQINKYVTRKKTTRIDQDHRVGDKF